MTRILFICHGCSNFCGSLMAVSIMKGLVKKVGLEQEFQIESATITQEEYKKPVHSPVCQSLQEQEINYFRNTPKQLHNRDYENYDLLIGMDQNTLHHMYRICGGDFSEKMHLLMDFTDRPGNVADPWYTRDFKATWQDVTEGCQGLLNALTKK